MNILLIEDEQMVRKAISHHLLESGHTVSTAVNGKEAADMMAQDKKFDLVICDVMMPILTGPSFLLMLQKRYQGKRPHIIVISGDKVGEEYLKKIEIPYDHYINKPVKPAELDRLINSLRADASA